MDTVKNFYQTKVFKYLLFTLMGTLILAISSKIKIPFFPVPMTMQTFVIILIGIGYGWKLGVATIMLYLLEGIIGLPVFSGTPEKGTGIIYFTGPTMGYLIGFLITVFLVGNFNYKNNLDKNLALDDIKFKFNNNNTITAIYEKNSHDFEDIIEYLKEKGVKTLDIVTEDGDLEDVFIQLTKNN